MMLPMFITMGLLQCVSFALLCLTARRAEFWRERCERQTRRLEAIEKDLVAIRGMIGKR